mmetsp:Transcript_27598/g.74789  ORF Transcript_27598/g.74789 Transcript_27598/m.74789 type:complete len:91 (+) Transcript_27598:265-537(+)
MRRAKLQLLAECAPGPTAALEALTCEAEPSLAPASAALAFGLAAHAGERTPGLTRSASAGPLPLSGDRAAAQRAQSDCVQQGRPLLAFEA